jgi:hypothetical protein
MNRHEEASSAGLTLAIVIGLILCLLLVGGGGVAGFLYLRQQTRLAHMRAEVEMERAQVESQLAQFGQTPGASHAARGTPQLIKIDFDTSGMYDVDGETLTGEELQIYPTEKAAANPGNIAVELRPADDTAYVLVSGLTALCEKSGVKDVTIGKTEVKE